MNAALEAGTFDYLRRLLVDEFEIEPEVIQPDAHLADDLGIDSIDAVDLLVHMREVIGRDFPRERFKSVRTLQDIVDIIDREQAAPNPT